MRYLGTVCNQHQDQRVGHVSKAVKAAWENNEPWDERIVLIRHQMFSEDEEGFPAWVTKEEIEDFGLPLSCPLNDDQTEEFIKWQSGRMVLMCLSCLKQWMGKSPDQEQ